MVSEFISMMEAFKVKGEDQDRLVSIGYQQQPKTRSQTEHDMQNQFTDQIQLSADTLILIYLRN